MPLAELMYLRHLSAILQWSFQPASSRVWSGLVCLFRIPGPPPTYHDAHEKNHTLLQDILTSTKETVEVGWVREHLEP